MKSPKNTLARVPVGHPIVGLGYGLKTSGRNIVYGSLAVRVYVKAKKPIGELAAAEIIPLHINGIPTDVVPVGDLRAFSRCDCGVSVGEVDATYGTLGCLVSSLDDATSRYILSNNHVLANVNSAALGAHILQPGPGDGGIDPGDYIADLTDFEPIRLVSFNSPADARPNNYDAAIAQLLDPSSVDPTIADIGVIDGSPLAATAKQSVEKHGTMSLTTMGVVSDVHAAVRVRYGTQVADYVNQIAIQGVGGAFSEDGDSGALVLDSGSTRPVGLLFAGGNGTSFASPVAPILSRFNVQIVSGGS